MKRNFLTLAVAILSLGVVVAQSHTLNQHKSTNDLPQDSIALQAELLQINVGATRATESTPVAYTNISHEQIERNNYGLNIPSLLALTPSMIATNETGGGLPPTDLPNSLFRLRPRIILSFFNIISDSASEEKRENINDPVCDIVPSTSISRKYGLRQVSCIRRSTK